MKKIVAILLAMLMLLSLIACGKDVMPPADSEVESDTATTPADTTPAPTTPDSTDDEENEGGDGDANDGESDGDHEDGGAEDDDETTTVALNQNTAGIKLLGVRGIASDSQINCDWSGSGIEFVLLNISRSLVIEANSSAPCRFKVYVNGELFPSPLGDDFYEINGNSMISLAGLPVGNVTIRLVRITEAAMATAQLTKMTFSGMISSDAPRDNEMYIEFVGGTEVGGIGLAEGDGYRSHDVTKAYSYLLAESLDADYAMTTLGTTEALTSVEDVAALYAKASPVRDTSSVYAFHRKADVVVVDLGAVDVALSATSSEITAEAFAEKYEALLTAIRQKNGEDCKIVCVYTSAMGDFATALLNVCRKEMGGQSNGFYNCQLALGEDSLPSAAEREAFLTLLETVIDNALDGVITEGEMGTAESGGGLSVDFKEDFVPVR